jgi:small-conductance mechanosensitive channel
MHEFYREVSRLLEGIDANIFLTVLAAVVIGGIVLYLIGTAFAIIGRVALAGLFLFAAYLVYQYNESIPFVAGLQSALRDLIPYAPPITTLLIPSLIFLALYTLYRTFRD